VASGEKERDVGRGRESGVASVKGKSQSWKRETEGKMIRAKVLGHGEGPRMESRTGLRKAK